MTKTERNIRQVIKDLGGRLLSLKQTKHFRARIARPDGTEFTYICAVSPSDSSRGLKNMESQIRKMLAGEMV